MCAPAIMAITSIASIGMSMMGAQAQSDAQAAAYEQRKAEYEAQAKLQNRQATIENIAAGNQARRAKEKLDALGAKQLAGWAGSGFALEGSLPDVMADTASEGMLDIEAIDWNARLKSGNLNYAAATSYMNAAQAGQAAQTTKDNAWMGVASAGLSGISGMFSGSVGTQLAKSFG